MKSMKLLVSLAAVLAAMACVAAAPALASGPVNLTRPSISPNSPYKGDVLTESPGTWSEGGLFTKQWMRCDGAGANCVAITGATQAEYTVGSADVGHTLVVEIKDHATSGIGTAFSPATAVVQVGVEISPAPTETSPLLFTGGGRIILELQNQSGWECHVEISGRFVNATEARQTKASFSECSGGHINFTTESLKGSLGYLNLATHKVGLKLTPETGNVFVKSFYHGAPIEGTVFGVISPASRKSSSFELGYSESKGVQEFQDFEHPFESVKQHLEWAGEQTMGLSSGLNPLKLSTNREVEIKG
jgi:hypothetical protein